MAFAWSDDIITGLFNWVMTLLYGILTADWGALDGSNVANLVESINQSGMVPIGVTIVHALILVNLCKNTTTYMDLKRPALLLRTFLRLIVADAIVIFSYTVFKWLYDIFAGIVRVLFETAGISGANGFIGLIEGNKTEIAMDFFAMFPAFILCLISMVVSVVICFSVLLTVLGRWFKIYLYVMIAPVPVSLLSCEGADRVGKSYLFSFFAICMEGLAIAAACVIFAMYIRSGDILKMNGGSNVLTQAFSVFGEDGGQVLANQVGMLLNMSIFAGLVKGSDRLVREMVGG